MSSTFKILFFARKNRLNKDKLTPVIVRITIEGEALEFSTRINIPPQLWDADKGKLTGKTKVAVDANIALEKINTRLRNKFHEIEDKIGYVTPELLKNAFFGLEEKTTTLLVLFDKKIEQKQALAKALIKQSAVVKYENTRSRLMEFIPQYSNTKDIAIKDVNYDFITGFDTFLRTTYNCRHNTVVKYLRYLKQVTTEAIKSGLIRIDPFMDIKLSSKKGNRKYLTKEELKTIMSRNFVSETLTEARDIFVFGCFTGFAYVDISKLTKDDIIEGENNQKFIIKDRTKTSVESFVPLFDTPLKIISKYEKLNLSGNKLFPVSACQVYNRYLKEIAALCDITKTLSSHVARHKEMFYQLLISRLHAENFGIGNDLETSLVLRYA